VVLCGVVLCGVVWCYDRQVKVLELNPLLQASSHSLILFFSLSPLPASIPTILSTSNACPSYPLHYLTFIAFSPFHFRPSIPDPSLTISLHPPQAEEWLSKIHPQTVSINVTRQAASIVLQAADDLVLKFIDEGKGEREVERGEEERER
jgi:hypothetical protein